MRFFLKIDAERYRGGTRIVKLLAANQTAVPIQIEQHTPIYVDLENPNWQARQLFRETPIRRWNYEPHVSDLFRQLVRPSDIVFDIGANIGMDTVLLSSLAASVFAFEPNPKLSKNLQLTLEPLANAALFTVALSDNCGWTRLFVPESHDMASLGNWRESSVSFEIETATLDSLSLPHPDVIKCDVEGAEFKVFRGATTILADATNAPLVFFEEQANAAGTLGASQREAQRFLGSLPSQYQFFLIDRETRSIQPLSENRPDWCDILAVPACRFARLRNLGSQLGTLTHAGAN